MKPAPEMGSQRKGLHSREAFGFDDGHMQGDINRDDASR